MRHLIDRWILSVEDIDRLLDRADGIAKRIQSIREVCKHKKLATLFFGQSTRTRLSFEAAMLELEVFLDFLLLIHHLHLKEKVLQIFCLRVIECYADIIAMQIIKGRSAI